MIKAADFAAQGEKYLGRSYDEMDCRELVNRMLADVGGVKRYKGSNELYRDLKWCGSPEECVAAFGCVPSGALLFIWANDGGEIARGYTDGLGNASHVGCAIGTTGDHGAIHSSSSKKCVAWSKFYNKTINGGWNYVGLLNGLDYGDKIETMIKNESEGEIIMQTGILTAMTGTTVNLRREPKKANNLIRAVPVGTTVDVLDAAGDGWYRVKCGSMIGYVMQEFVELVEEVTAPGVPSVEDNNPPVSITLPYAVAVMLRDQLINEIGVG